MSNEALTWAFAQTTVIGDKSPVPGAKAVLIALADKADERHTCWPSQETLAAMTDQGVRTVRRHLAWLEEHHFIKTEVRRNPDGTRSSDRYLLSVAVSVPAHQSPATFADQPANLAGSQAANLAGSEPAANLAGSTPAKPGGRQRKTSATTGQIGQVTLNKELTTKDSPRKVNDDEPREEIRRLCDLLADLIAANDEDHKRPTVGKAWFRECRLLIDVDGRPAEKVEACIRWATTDSFWHKQILSMGNLRKHYARMSLDARDQHARPKVGRVAPPPMSRQQVAAVRIPTTS